MRILACSLLLSVLGISPLLSVTANSATDERAAQYLFHRVGEPAGLTPDVVTRLFRDQRGLLWVGTREGLFLFDGYSARRFAHDPDDEGSISDTSIRAIFEDKAGSLWFGTNTGGMCRLDRGENDFKCFRPEPENENSLSNASVYAFAQDRQGDIWIGTQAGLNLISGADGRISRQPFDAGHPDGAGQEYVTALHVDTQGQLWVGTVGRGLFVKGQDDPAFVPVTAALGFEDASVFSFLEDHQGRLWVGGDRSMYHLDPGKHRLERVSLDVLTGGESVAVTSLLEWAPGQLFATTFGAGLIEVETGSGQIIRHAGRPGDPHGPGEERLTDVVSDAGGGLMVATWGAGLQRTTRASQLFSGIQQFIDATGALVRLEDVESVAGNEETGIWAGSLTSGLMAVEDGKVGKALVAFPLGDVASPASIVTVYPESGDKLWAGSVVGLAEIDTKTMDYSWYRNDPQDPASLGAGWITRMVKDKAGRLWIGTGGSGLWAMEPDGSLTGHVSEDADPTTISGDYITSLALDEFGQLWVATRSHGVNLCQTAPFSCERYDPADGADLRHHYVTAIHRDFEGMWWLGTAGGGLHRVRRGVDGLIEGFEHFGLERGLPDTTVMALQNDTDGSLWVATRRGLSRMDADRRRVVSYLESDGLVSDVFNRGAAASDGLRLYFGAVNGIVHLPVGTPFEAPSGAPLIFTQVQNLTEGLSLGGAHWVDPELSVPMGDVLQFSFALLDYEGGKHSYAYRLGDKDEWTSLDTSRQITFGDLPPGRHDLQIKGLSTRGVPALSSIPIEVIPPFWMTRWFRGLALLLLGLLILGIHSIRMAGLQRRNEALQQLTDQRERALEKLQRSESELSEAAEGLRRLASRLESAKEEERQHISRELHDELGQTLTAAKISLQMLQNDPDPSRERLQEAVGMMDSMIGQVRAISLDLRPPLLDEAGLVPALKSELQQVSKHTGLPVKLEVEDNFPALPAEIETVLFRAIQESVSNSLRHARATEILISLSLQGEKACAVIRDDGEGFDVGQARQRALRGEHLGLLGLDERVNAVGGSVRLESVAGEGTLLRIHIPVPGWKS